MILMPCPWCGPRNVAEFAYRGELAVRPDVATTTPEEWRAYLFVRDNPRGWTTEQWLHRAGCHRFFVAERHTVTNEVRATRAPARQLGHAAGSEPTGAEPPSEGRA
jgi:heterotetrameric sarcosine oxidase delta subunit